MLPHVIIPSEAGRELDALVAEKVIGWQIHQPNWGCPPAVRRPGGAISLYLPEAVPHYSTSIAAVWEVMEALRQRGVHLRVSSAYRGYEVQRWERDQWCSTEYGETAPLAICLAALKAVAVSPTEPVP